MSRKTGKGQTAKQVDTLEALWDDLLSRQPERVQVAYGSLAADDQLVVLAHLERMASEDGWQPEQRRSARAALRALDYQTK
jgi:hypothetical protein